MSSKKHSNLTNQIRRLRFENNEMTQEQLAQEVGVTRQTIIALEAGKYVPSLVLAIRIAKTFNKQVEEVWCQTPDT
ncbi:MAG: helix-turn-helix transcriptional regulator [Deltaproteobacteria bacterium]|nr:helix-turn-helix transcriptional regulator [Deltaproteobacteria bacterium]